MLGKLFKYEMSATARLFLPLYALTGIFTIIGRVIFSRMMVTNGQSYFLDMIFTFMMMAYMVLIFSITIMTGVIIIRRFYLNLLGQDGYLMHTLPVTTHQLILSKLLSAFVWQSLTLVVLVLSVMGIFITGEMLMFMPDFMAGFGEMVGYLFEVEGARLIFDGALVLVAMSVGTITSLILYYVAMALGHTVKKHKIWASFGAYFAINFVVQQVSYWVSMLLGGGMFSYYAQSNFMDDSMFLDPSMIYDSYMSSFYISLVLYILVICGGYFTTHYILKNKLNLE